MTRAEWDRHVELGHYEGEHVELIDGLVVETGPQSARHSWWVQVLDHILVPQTPEGWHVAVRAPFAAGGWSEPEPDFAVVPDSGPSAHPSVAQLVIEVSVSSLRYDLATKARVYAGAGVPEYWVVDVEGGVVHVCTDPDADGYRTVREAHGSVTARHTPVRIDFADLFSASTDDE